MCEKIHNAVPPVRGPHAHCYCGNDFHEDERLLAFSNLQCAPPRPPRHSRAGAMLPSPSWLTAVSYSKQLEPKTLARM